MTSYSSGHAYSHIVCMRCTLISVMLSDKDEMISEAEEGEDDGSQIES